MCSVAGCDRDVLQRGMCRTHYFRWWRHGDPLIVKPRGRGIHDLSPERRAAVLKEAGRKAGNSKARNRETDGWWFHWLLTAVRVEFNRKRVGRPSKDVCIRGHELSGENLYLTPDNRRQCRTCQAMRVLAWSHQLPQRYGHSARNVPSRKGTVALGRFQLIAESR